MTPKEKASEIKHIDDLSYSNLVDIIQGEDIKAADVLTSIAYEAEETNIIISKLEMDLAISKTRKKALIDGAKKVLKHIEKEPPLAVQRNGFIVVVTDENISIERNVI